MNVRRKIVRIDPEKCDGCGLCAPACAEGAIQIIEGKARLVSESYCDGLGACLGECPRGAITIEERPAAAFDAAAAEAHAKAAPAPPALPCGCPGTMARQLPRRPATTAAPGRERPSQLAHWPVQLQLLSPTAPCFQDADLLVAADCVPVALPDFHERLLAGRAVAVACPKLDDLQAHVRRLTEILSANDIRSVTVAHMEVPCCRGIVHAVETALERAGKAGLPIRDVTIGLDGTVRQEMPADEAR